MSPSKSRVRLRMAGHMGWQDVAFSIQQASDTTTLGGGRRAAINRAHLLGPAAAALLRRIDRRLRATWPEGAVGGSSPKPAVKECAHYFLVKNAISRSVALHLVILLV
ncbi:hypothetical protein MRX96_028448 [Rhipicephalus microplus]